jgi:hypothetical protein
VRDPNVTSQADPAGNQTVITSVNKSDAKLKKFATLDVRITKAGE